MAAEDFGEALGLLAAEAGVPLAQARVITTHISVVLLVGERAFKLKRPVALPYLDFSTPEKRLAACEREFWLNRRTAPSLYLAVRRLTRGPDGRLALDGDGVLVDAAVEMARFDEDGLFDRMAQEARLTPALVTVLAGCIARFHAGAEIARDRGGAEAMASVLAINANGFALTHRLPAEDVAALEAACQEALDRHRPLLDARGREGRIRRCHGDLHLRNICLVAGQPTLFDALEFNEALATTDVLYDLAFVLMDLWHRDLACLANILLNRYLDITDDEAGLPLLPFFMAVRAAVRAHVVAVQARDDGDARVLDEARSYLALALRCLAPRAARLVAVGGLSGAGKSTVAAAVAPGIGPVPGARILASDRLRKRRYGVEPQVRLPPEAYSPAVSEAVFAEQAQRAGAILRRGHGVVADAVFDRIPDRERIARAAHEAGVAFQGLWLEAPAPILIARVEARRGDPSDATGEIVRQQLGRATPVEDWRRLSTEAGPEAVCREARAVVDEADSPAVA